MGSGFAAGANLGSEMVRRKGNSELDRMRFDEEKKRIADLRADANERDSVAQAQNDRVFQMQQENNQYARDRQDRLDAITAGRTANADAWEAEKARQDSLLSEEKLVRARLERDKYLEVARQESEQLANRKRALETGIGSLLSTMSMNGGVLPVSAMNLFNDQNKESGMAVLGGAFSQEGGAVITFRDKNNEEGQMYYPPAQIQMIQETLFGKTSASGRATNPYAADSIGLKQDTLQVRTMQNHLNALSRRMEQLQKGLNDPVTSSDPAQSEKLKTAMEDAQGEYDYYNAQMLKIVGGVEPYQRKASGGGQDGEKPGKKSIYDEAPTVGARMAQKDGGVKKTTIGDDNVLIVSRSGQYGWIPRANLQKALAMGAKLAE